MYVIFFLEMVDVKTELKLGMKSFNYPHFDFGWFTYWLLGLNICCGGEYE